MAIEYTQRWLKDANAKTSNVGWFKPKTYEVLKTQKDMTVDEPVLAEKVYIVMDSEVDINSTVEVDVRFFPKVTTQKDFTITISDEEICSFDVDTNTLKFKEKSGNVDIVVKMTEGDAEFTKSVFVNKPSTGTYVLDGNAIPQGFDAWAIFKLLPEDTTEVVEEVTSFNNPNMKIVDYGEVVGSLMLNSDYVGTYDFRVKTNKTSYKTQIHVLENMESLVETITFDELADTYDHNTLIPFYPKFTPDTATKKDLVVVVDDAKIATYNYATNSFLTGNTDGETKVTVTPRVGFEATKLIFDIVVSEDGIKPKPPIETIKIVGLPDTLDIGVEYPYTVEVTPDGAETKYNPTLTGGLVVINNRAVKGTANGQASLTVKSTANKDVTDTKNVTVVTKVERLVLGSYEKNIISDSVKHDLPITINPADASNKGLTYTGSGVIKVDANNKYYADAVGTGKVKVTAKDGSNVSVETATITVTAPLVKVTDIDITGIPATVTVGDNVPFTVDVTPTNASDKTYTLTGSTNITITGNTFKVNTAMANSYVTATANDGSGVKKTVTFTAIPLPIKVATIDITGVPESSNVGDTVPFTVVVKPDNANDKTYTMSGSANITITGNSFKVNSPLANSFVTATANDGSGVKKTVNFVAVAKVATINVTGIPSEVEIGKEGTFAVEVLPANATDKTYTVTSSANVTVTGNKFTSNANGDSSITVTANDGSGVKKVTNFTTVTKVSSIDVTGVPTEMVEGDVVNDIVVTVNPSTATNKTFTTSTSDEWNATVSADGKTITAVGFGTCEITYSANDGSGVKKTFSVSVINPPTPMPQSITVDGIPPTMEVGNTAEGYVSIFPLNAEQSWTCSSSNTDVLTAVKGETSVGITAVSAGTSVITVVADKDNSIKFETTVTVS